MSESCGSSGGKQVREMVGAGSTFPNAGNGDHVESMRQTILLVEDEEMVRGLMCEVLEREGYEVLSCAHPKEGIEMSRRHGARFDLLLTDVVMPGMNGKELSERLRELRPNLKVLFISGYTADVIAHRGVLDRGVAFLHKPFSPEELAQKVRDALAAL